MPFPTFEEFRQAEVRALLFLGWLRLLDFGFIIAIPYKTIPATAIEIITYQLDFRSS